MIYPLRYAPRASKRTTYDAVADDALQLPPLVGRGREVELADRESNLADGVVLREPVEVVDREDQGLAHHLAVGDLGRVCRINLVIL